jgi:hypothetical protein
MPTARQLDNQTWDECKRNLISMNHVKELELEMLLKFEEVGGIISYRDFEKVFPTIILPIFDTKRLGC